MRSTHRFALRSLLLKTSAATAPDLARSVIAVPPLARLPDLELNAAANRVLIRHLEEGGVTTLMYGGNANFYNVGLYEYAAILDFLDRAVGRAGFRQVARSGPCAQDARVPHSDGSAADVSGDARWQ